ncbi:MAG: (2Fe-2S)-binding protein [Candidatus Nitrohelix vancouverensis]|uniref:(2Fe-2S)-binding protein n=1 Tax=Candidatus Nitrohelix vancouverensis TaxID=2705534 RepID=A0A7T0C0S4_9BACT|nr:MAG: (2Fe-2S)-binding protein [Candidatus Nitrohelix vancouverensis]
MNKAIADGCMSFEAVRKKIGAGTGNCHAKRCREKIEKMIQDYRESTKIGA